LRTEKKKKKLNRERKSLAPRSGVSSFKRTLTKKADFIAKKGRDLSGKTQQAHIAGDQYIHGKRRCIILKIFKIAYNIE